MLKRLTKKFLLNEEFKVDAGASVQALYDIISSIRVTNKRPGYLLQFLDEDDDDFMSDVNGTWEIRI